MEENTRNGKKYGKTSLVNVGEYSIIKEYGQYVISNPNGWQLTIPEMSQMSSFIELSLQFGYLEYLEQVLNLLLLVNTTPLSWGDVVTIYNSVIDAADGRL